VKLEFNVLAFDCAAASCSAAVRMGRDTAAHRFEGMERGQAEALVPMIEAVMGEARIGYSDLDVIAVTIGPGAFTGLRIALATARALSLAAELPLYGVSSFEAVLAGVSEPAGGHLIALETKRDDIYVQLFDANKNPATNPSAADAEALADMVRSWQPILVAGDAAARALNLLTATSIDAVMSPAPALVNATTVARMAAENWRPGGVVALPEPLYLRPPYAKLPVARRPRT